MTDQALVVPLTWAITAGISAISIVMGGVYLLLKAATDRFSSDAKALHQHLERHANEENEILNRLANENIDTRRRVGVLHERVEAVAAKIERAPSVDSVHAVSLQMRDLAGEMRAMNAAVGGLKDLVVRLDSQLSRHEAALLTERRS